MIGDGSFGINMLRRIIVVSCISVLTGCSALPGMQNPSTGSMVQSRTPQTIEVHPTLVPITSTLVADTRISLYIYRVAPADVLTIQVWQHPEFQFTFQAPLPDSAKVTTTRGAAGESGYLVNPYGEIYFPLIGYVHVAGKTVDQIRAILTTKLKRYIRNPQLSVRVADFRGQKIYVFGEVNKPGFIPLNDQPLTITDAITMSNSFDPNSSDPAHIYVIRGAFTHPTIYWLNAGTPDRLLLAEHFNLQPGDILYVSSALVTRWNRVINQLLPTVQAVYFTQSVVNNHN
jgi:polysaccharide export outer membrane protein